MVGSRVLVRMLVETGGTLQLATSLSGKANLPLLDKSLERTVLLIDILN